MFKHYAKVGESFFQTLPEEMPVPSGFIEMQTARPEPHYVATESGEWVEPEDNRDFKHFTGQAKLDLFTEQEQAAIIGAAYVGDIEVAMVYERFKIADYLTYSDPKVDAGLTLLVAKEKITAARKAEIIHAMTAERE